MCSQRPHESRANVSGEHQGQGDLRMLPASLPGSWGPGNVGSPGPSVTSIPRSQL